MCMCVHNACLSWSPGLLPLRECRRVSLSVCEISVIVCASEESGGRNCDCDQSKCPPFRDPSFPLQPLLQLVEPSLCLCAACSQPRFLRLSPGMRCKRSIQRLAQQACQTNMATRARQQGQAVTMSVPGGVEYGVTYADRTPCPYCRIRSIL